MIPCISDVKKRIYKKLCVIFIVIMMIMPCFLVTAYAAEGGSGGSTTISIPKSTTRAELSDTPQDGETEWPWPMDGIYKSVRQMMYDLIMGTLEGCFRLIDDVTNQANTELGKTPKEYQSSIYNVVETVAKNVVMPIGAIILTYVVVYEFITMIMDKNNFHEFDTSVFIRWIFKTTIAIYFLSNCLVIVNAFFDLGNMMGDRLVAALSGTNSGTMNSLIDNMSTTLCECGLGTFMSLLIPIGLLNIVCVIIYMCIFVIMIGRMVEIYVYMSIAPIPVATVTNRDFGDSGKNYLKTIFSFVLQAFFIILCIGIFRALIFSLSGSIASVAIDIKNTNVAWTLNSKIFEILAYGIVLVLTMFKSGSIAKSILGVH